MRAHRSLGENVVSEEFLKFIFGLEKKNIKNTISNMANCALENNKTEHIWVTSR